MSDAFLDRLNAAWVASFAPLPFSDRPCGRLDAAFRQAPELSDEDVEATLEHEAWQRSVGNDR